MVDAVADRGRVGANRRQTTLKKHLRRKATIALLMTLPLILIIGSLVISPAFYSFYLAMLNKSMERFVGLSNFTFLFTRGTFWMVVKQAIIFAVSAVGVKGLVG